MKTKTTEEFKKIYLEHCIQHFFDGLKEVELVSTEYQLKIDDKIYCANFVFYHTNFKCYIVINTTFKRIKYKDIGNITKLLKHFAIDQKTISSPIAIIFEVSKDYVTVQYATYGIKSELFISKHKTFLSMIEKIRLHISKIMINNK